jgi:hypothetical protein
MLQAPQGSCTFAGALVLELQRCDVFICKGCLFCMLAWQLTSVLLQGLH